MSQQTAKYQVSNPFSRPNRTEPHVFGGTQPSTTHPCVISYCCSLPRTLPCPMHLQLAAVAFIPSVLIICAPFHHHAYGFSLISVGSPIISTSRLRLTRLCSETFKQQQQQDGTNLQPLTTTRLVVDMKMSQSLKILLLTPTVNHTPWSTVQEISSFLRASARSCRRQERKNDASEASHHSHARPPSSSIKHGLPCQRH